MSETPDILADDVAPKRSLRRRIGVLVIEIVLVIVIVILLLATWLPAIIGANPDAPRGGPLP